MSMYDKDGAGCDFAPSGYHELKDIPMVLSEWRDTKEIEEKFRAIRNEYRIKMNTAEQMTQAAAGNDDMRTCSEHSLSSERYREAFHALNRVADIFYKLIDIAERRETAPVTPEKE
jgi:hypothetical protein